MTTAPKAISIAPIQIPSIPDTARPPFQSCRSLARALISGGALNSRNSAVPFFRNVLSATACWAVSRMEAVFRCSPKIPVGRSAAKVRSEGRIIIIYVNAAILKLKLFNLHHLGAVAFERNLKCNPSQECVVLSVLKIVEKVH